MFSHVELQEPHHHNIRELCTDSVKKWLTFHVMSFMSRISAAIQYSGRLWGWLGMYHVCVETGRKCRLHTTKEPYYTPRQWRELMSWHVRQWIRVLGFVNALKVNEWTELNWMSFKPWQSHDNFMNSASTQGGSRLRMMEGRILLNNLLSNDTDCMWIQHVLFVCLLNCQYPFIKEHLLNMHQKCFSPNERLLWLWFSHAQNRFLLEKPGPAFYPKHTVRDGFNLTDQWVIIKAAPVWKKKSLNMNFKTSQITL